LLVPLLSCLLLLAGCGHDDGAVRKGPETSVGSRTTGPGAGGLKAYYDQKLRWTGCGKDLCASLRVPVDYAHPQRASIGLAVEKAPATGHRVGALIANPGGPGASGTILASDRDEFFGQPLISAYDIVGFDPRGTGRSDPVDCLSDRQLTDFIAEDPAPDDAAEAKAYSGMTRTFWRGCKERSDALAGHVSTVEAARDMDVLRAALGQKKMDYFGFSYGTELGATYAELFPKQVGRMVLDGAVDVALSTRESALHQAAGFETALRAYVGHCVEAGRCFLGPTVDAGLQRIKRLLESVDRHPMRTSKGRRLTVGNAFYGIVAPLYSRDLWSYLDTGLRQALAGDGTVLLTLSDAYTMRRDDGSYSDNSMEAISVISCLDDPWSISAAQVPGQVAAFREASPTFGEVFAWGLTSCAGDPYRSHDRPGLTIDAAGAAPIVVVGTTRDPATPYEEAVALAHELRSGVLLTRDGDGHTGYHQGNPCIDDAVEGYLVKGTVPADGTRC
jgi:pimeloyl-ACP methyl ester carboxylesterase